MVIQSDNCFDPRKIKGEFFFNKEIINEILVPTVVDECTSDLAVFFYINEMKRIGYLNKNFEIIEKSNEVECNNTNQFYLNIKNIKLKNYLIL